MVRILDYNATQPLDRFDVAQSFTINSTPNRTDLANIKIRIPHSCAVPNRVELVATVGVRGITNISQILFRIFRDGIEIFNTLVGIESTDSEQNYVVTFQAIDSNVRSGCHVYSLTAENLAPDTRADVVGPISFSGLAIQTRH
ncbi:MULTISPECIES: hypothetical protein [Brevibacillus]|uniref:hypothetical protein n=1 Tax=Brevibacillus TaxID=55080 RepID=UPI0002404E68|nr:MULTISPECIES: hypothetical protein [Brevibacillus]AUM64342.1 exosporium protein C [Brevibacillus laterosporus]AYK07257.1 exosporium protein C [Brevibacillus laterosporus]MBA4531062.1 exosporium protein C [Brevibacillus halotolerans]MCR8965784.1 exosporium protein C [Brevibacillus laterosporus]MCZ0837939.1 exosporium protein C [Brevibacillus halotolerans]